MAKSLLSTLNFVDEKKPVVNAANKADPVKKFIGAVSDQIAYVTSEKNGEAIVSKSGKKPRLWHWKKADGVYRVSVMYGTAPVPVVDGKNVVLAGKSLDDVLKVLNTIKAAAEAGEGEIVDPIHKAAMEVSKRLEGKRGGGRKKAS